LQEQITLHDDDIIIPVSALTGQGCDQLLESASQLLTADAKLHSFVISASDGQRLAWLHAHGEVVSDDDAGGSGGESADAPQRRLKVRLTPRELGRFSQL